MEFKRVACHCRRIYGVVGSRRLNLTICCANEPSLPLGEECFLMGNDLMWNVATDQIECPRCNNPIVADTGEPVTLRTAGYLHISLDWVCEDTWRMLDPDDEKVFAPIPPKPDSD